MSRLERIQVKGFKSIRELDLELRALNILIGANGAGKSNFISVFELLSQVLAGRLGQYSLQIEANNLLHHGIKVTSNIELMVKFGTNFYDATFVPTRDGRLIFEKESIGYTDPNRLPLQSFTLLMVRDNRETHLHINAIDSVAGSEIANEVLSALEGIGIYHFHDTSRTAAVKLTGDLNDNEFLRSDASNLAAFLYWMRIKHNERYQRIVNTIRLIAPFFDDFNLHPSRLHEDKIRLEWRERASEKYFDAHSLSDGTLRFICLCTLLLQPNLPSTILIDEPELGLHPTAITILAELLRSASQQTQVIVSTQSVPLVNQFEPEDLIVVDRDDGQSVFKRLSAEQLENWLENYSLGELWEKNVLGGRP